MFIGGDLDNTRRITAEIRAGAESQGNPGIKILRYWNVWWAYQPEEANYTEQMYLHDSWPESTGTRFVKRKDDEETGGLVCTDDLVDVSRDDLKAEIARVIAGFLPDTDGVYFDISAWDIWLRKEFGLKGVQNCPPPADSSAFIVNDFKGQSKDFMVAYHRYMQDTVIDPPHTGVKWQICNGLPRNPADADPTSEARYLEIVDGCQMDTAFVRQNEEKYVTENWRWQVETMRRFAAAQRYFLTKVTRLLGGKPATDRLDYGFASYLLGTDGRYALWWPTRYIDWETEKVVSAPLGNFVGDYGPVPGFTHTYVRTFENGLVYVNADTVKRTVTLPAGSNRDVRGGTYKERLTLNGASAKILIKSP